MRTKAFGAGLAITLAVIAPLGVVMQAQAEGKKKSAMSATSAMSADEAARRYFTDNELIDQDGKPRRFYSDLMRGKKVLINFAFTSCKAVCPTTTANLARVQKLLGKRVGSEIVMITISVDPLNDTPSVLKTFADKFKTAPGWYFLTGTTENVEMVLKRVGGLVKKPDEHSTALFVGDLKTGYWVKGLATASPEEIVYLVDHLNDGPTKRK